MRKKNIDHTLKDTKRSNDPTERIIIENRVDFILNLFFSIVFVILTYMCYPNWGLVAFFSFCLCLTIYSAKNKYLDESFFIINSSGFSYGGRKRHGKKRVIFQKDYKWAEIKELYFKKDYKGRVRLMVVYKTKRGHQEIPLCCLPFNTHLQPLKELKSLIKEYSQRDDIFRKQFLL